MRARWSTRHGAPIGLVLAGAAVFAIFPEACRSRPRWNVLLVTFDTTRADHIGCYGHASARTPTVDRLAAEGVLFRNAYSSIPLTCPSHSTILTGKYPLAHGVRDNGLFVLAPEQRTLAEILKEHGYRTAAAIGGFPLVKRFGLDQGFDLYDDKLSPKYNNALMGGGGPPRPRFFFEERKAARVNEAAWSWLDENAKRPFFLWIHYYDPHQPLDPPVPYNETFAREPYDGEIAYADESFGVLIDRLKHLGVYDRTLVVFTADHGEGLGEHDELTHSYLLYNSTLHVPLVIRPPDGPRGRVLEGRVRLVDVAPTILGVLGIPVPADMQGRSLLPLVSEASPRVDLTHYAETLSPRLSQNLGELRALIEDRWKYVHGPKPELFDLGADPNETRNLAPSRPDVAARMRNELADFLKRNSPPGGSRMVPVDAETRQNLEALGYLAAGAGDQEIREELRDDGIAPQDVAREISILSMAREMLEHGQALAARDLALGVLAKAPDALFFLEVLATAEVQLGRPDAALPAVERILAAGPSRGSAERLLLYIGSVHYQRGQREEGLRHIRRSLDLKPTAEGFYLLASLQAIEGGRDEERASLERALQLDPRYAPARTDLAVRLAQAGKRSEARAELERVLRDSPYFAKAHYNYGAFLLESGELEAALAAFVRAVKLDPGYSRARYAEIAVRLRLGQRPEAERALAELEARAAGSAEAQQARALFGETR